VINHMAPQPCATGIDTPACPSWCVEHTDHDDRRCGGSVSRHHTGVPLVVTIGNHEFTDLVRLTLERYDEDRRPGSTSVASALWDPPAEGWLTLVTPLSLTSARELAAALLRAVDAAGGAR